MPAIRLNASLKRAGTTRWKTGARWILAALALCAATFGGATAKADDEIWTALILATNEEHPSNPPAELARFSGKIQRFFGYNQLAMIGSATKSIDEKEERWLVPSQDFWVCAKSKKAGDSNYVLDVQLFHDKRRLLQTQAKVAPGSPLFIRGPLHARGQLIIAVQVLQ